VTDGTHRGALRNRRPRVVHVNSSGVDGGAGRACGFLDSALRAAGIDSRVLAGSELPPASVEVNGGDELIRNVFVTTNRTAMSNTHFSLCLNGLDLSALRAIREADVVHLHWVASIQTPWTLQRLLALDKVVVWTLHDFAPFTGGCHYPAGCAGFESSCSRCPQLRTDPFDVPAAVLEDKVELLDVRDVTLVAPSSWIAEQARASALFRAAPRIEVVRPGIDTDVFRPRGHAGARAILGVPQEPAYVFCGADQGRELRKGLPSLARVLADVSRHPALYGRRVAVLCVGDNVPEELFPAGVEVIPLGRIAAEDEMAVALSAADAFLFPSLEDNAPNMVLESLACARPVVAFDVGGVPELVPDGIAGRCVPAGDERALAEALASLLANPSLGRELGERGRGRVCERHSARAQAARMVELYEGALDLAADDRRSRQKRLHGSALPVWPGDPGPALSALIEPLTVHCLEEEVRRLRQQVRAYERKSMVESHALRALRAHASGLEAANARMTDTVAALDQGYVQVAVEAAARLEVIEDLRDRLARAEAARLRVIDELEAHRLWLEADKARRRHWGPRALLAGWRATRFDDWWYSKVPPLLAIAYLQVALARSYELWSLLPWLIVSLVCVAAYGHVINDSFDVEADRRAGKANAMSRHGIRARAAFAGSLAAVAFAPAFVVRYPVAALAVLGINLLLPTIYSIPATRLKERGVAGLVCDVGGSHIVPALFLLIALHRGSHGVSPHEWVFTVAALAWSGALGLKGILHHQLRDRSGDLASGTATFATMVEAGRIERWLPRYNLFVEAPVSLFLSCVVVDVCPLAAIAFAGYVVVESVKYRLGFQFALSPDPRSLRTSFPFVNEAFYVLWLPLAAALQLAIGSPAWLWAPIVQVVAFFPTVRVHAADLAATFRAALDRGGWSVSSMLRRRAS
jgi:glycosyltransferase involved in cell wall biosynthesis/4-hydroxybenzoate polyprenyltransferase